MGFSGIVMPDHTRRRCDQAYEGSTPAQNRIGVGLFPGSVQAHVSRTARLFN